MILVRMSSGFCALSLPVIGALFIRKGFWDRQWANILSRCKKMYCENLFRRPKKDFGERSKLFSTHIYQKSIWAMLIRGKCKFLFELDLP